MDLHQLNYSDYILYTIDDIDIVHLIAKEYIILAEKYKFSIENKINLLKFFLTSTNVLRMNTSLEEFKLFTEILGINNFSINDSVLLICAIANNYTEFKYDIIKYILENGADACVLNNICIKFAASNSVIETAKLLIQYGANIHTDNDYPFRIACEHGSTTMIKFLISIGANIHAGREFGLKTAVEIDDHNMLKLLIDSGANIDIDNGYVLKQSIENGHYECLKTLVNAGADLKFLTTNDLIFAIKSRSYNIVKLLMDHGIDFTQLNDIDIGVGRDISQIVGLLESRGVEIKKITEIFSFVNKD